MRFPESVTQPNHSTREAMRKVARTSAGKAAVLALACSAAATGCVAQSSGDTTVSVAPASSDDHSFWVEPKPEVAQLNGRDVECMAQRSGSGRFVIDCDWRAYHANPHYVAPASLTRLALSEHNEPYGNGTLHCLAFTLSAGLTGETCDWEDPAIKNKTPDMSKPAQAALYQVMTYKGHERNCVVKDTYPDLHQYSCDLDKDYTAPPTEKRIPVNDLTALSGIPWQGGQVSGFEYRQDYGFLCATIDWKTADSIAPVQY